MAKTSMINREVKRTRLVKKYAGNLLSADVNLPEVGEALIGQTPATIREVRSSSKPSSGWAWMSRRISRSSASWARMSVNSVMWGLSHSRTVAGWIQHRPAGAAATTGAGAAASSSSRGGLAATITGSSEPWRTALMPAEPRGIK